MIASLDARNDANTALESSRFEAFQFQPRRFG